MTVHILADSGCDLPLSFFEENHVSLFPLKVHLEDQEFDDLISIDPKQVYDAIRQGHVPKTSQVSPMAFKDKFTSMAENNEDGIYISFSSGLSGTYQTAVMMLEQVKESFPHFNLTIIDSKCASLGLGLVVQEAASLASKNVPKEEIINHIQFLCQHMEHLFTVHDLEYLAKGGRVSKASAFLGGLLNIKPLLNVEEGKLVPIEKHRGKKKLLRRIIEIMNERGESIEQQVIGISHADDEETALEMKALIEQELNANKFLINSIGATIGSHTGAGTIAIFFFNKLNK